jgi:hypothetical protein
MAPTIGIPSSTAKQGLFFTFLHTQSQKGKKIQKIIAKQHSFM